MQPNVVIEKKSLTDQIYETLRHEIVHRKIKPSEKIDINSLKQQFGVSQTPIREALMKLEKDGLVRFKTNIGAEVVKLDTKTRDEITEMMAVLDCMAVEKAMRSGSVDQLKKDLRAAISKQEKTIDKEDEYWDNSNKVHWVFYNYAGNTILTGMESRLHTIFDLMFGEFVEKKENRKIGISEHKMLLDAVEKEDIPLAVSIMKDHMLNSPNLMEIRPD